VFLVVLWGVLVVLRLLLVVLEFEDEVGLVVARGIVGHALLLQFKQGGSDMDEV